MKNLYIYYSILLLSSCFGYGQDLTNNNWYFGQKAGLNFATAPPTALSNSAMQQVEGCATISDKVTGQLLFYTNGVNVWDSTHTIMSNSISPVLSGHQSSGQSAIIVPHPGNSNQYYIFCSPAIGELASYFSYSIVDMTLNAPYGDVVSTAKNISMLNEFGSPFALKSEALTSTTNYDESGYWVLYPYIDKLYAYSVDSTGLNIAPVVSGLTFTAANTGITSCIKVSPDNTKIGISSYGYTNVGNQTRVNGFNNFTGTADTSYEIAINDKSIYYLEFAPKDPYVHFNNTQGAGGVGKIITYHTATFVNSELNVSINRGAFQLASNREIYIANPNGTYLHKLTNPNSATPGFTNNAVALASGKTSSYGLPQLIRTLNPCRVNLTLDQPEVKAQHTYKVANEITSKLAYTVFPGQDISFKANAVQLSANSHIKKGALFLAQIDPCTFGLLRPTATAEKMEAKLDPASPVLSIFPNPAEKIANIRMDGASFHHYSITSVDGKIMVDKPIAEKDFFSIDISQYSKGIYIVTVETTDGEIVTAKLIKS